MLVIRSNVCSIPALLLCLGCNEHGLTPKQEAIRCQNQVLSIIIRPPRFARIMMHMVGIRLLTERKQQPNSDIDLSLPGLEFGLAVDAEKELLKFKRGIEKVLPEKVRKDLGMSSQRVDDPRPENGL